MARAAQGWGTNAASAQTGTNTGSKGRKKLKELGRTSKKCCLRQQKINISQKHQCLFLQTTWTRSVMEPQLCPKICVPSLPCWLVQAGGGSSTPQNRHWLSMGTGTQPEVSPWLSTILSQQRSPLQNSSWKGAVDLQFGCVQEPKDRQDSHQGYVRFDLLPRDSFPPS